LNILIVKLTALGDVTHTLPALTNLRRALPDAHITWLVEDSAQDLLHGHPALNRILVWPRKQWGKLTQEKHFLELTSNFRRFVRELRDTQYDLAIDFQGLLKSATWMTLARARRKAGYGPGQRHDEHAWHALNERIPVTLPNAHAIDRNLRLVEALGFPRLPIAFDLPAPEEPRQEIERLLAATGIAPDARFVAINSMTRWPTKNWTPSHFAAVADHLLSKEVPVVFTGAPADREAVDAIVAGMNRRPAIRLDGLTSLPALAALFRRAAVVLSTDTGPMHIAVAVGTPVVALFGPTSPEYTGPYGKQNRVLRADLSCSPCYARTCRTTAFEPHACMLRLDPQNVAEEVLAVLRSR